MLSLLLGADAAGMDDGQSIGVWVSVRVLPVLIPTLVSSEPFASLRLLSMAVVADSAIFEDGTTGLWARMRFLVSLAAASGHPSC